MTSQFLRSLVMHESSNISPTFNCTTAAEKNHKTVPENVKYKTYWTEEIWTSVHHYVQRYYGKGKGMYAINYKVKCNASTYL